MHFFFFFCSRELPVQLSASLKGENEAEADVAAPILRREAAPRDRAARQRVVEKAAAAKNPGHALIRRLRILHYAALVALRIIISRKPITAPFPNIAAHIV